MNCVLFAKMDQVVSKENREFYQSGKMGTLELLRGNFFLATMIKIVTNNGKTSPHR